MKENRNNRKVYLIVAIAACAVVLTALGILLGYKLTKKETPTEAPTETPTEAPTETSTVTPTEAPTETPTVTPTGAPTETPTEAPTEIPTETPTEAPKDAETPSSGEETAEAGEWILYKTREHSGNKKRDLDREREYFYDEQGRLTKEQCYDVHDDAIWYTIYYSYGQNGEKMENWWPDRGGQLYSVEFTDMTGKVVYVDGYHGETYQEEFYDDGLIKEFRVYGNQAKELEKMVKWEYDAERKNIRRTTYYKDFGNGELNLVDDLRVELDSEGRIVRYVDHEARNENGLVPSDTEYECRYEGNRRIETYTGEKGAVNEFVYEGDRLITEKRRYKDGTGRIREYFYPNAKLLESECLFSEIEVEADGTEIPLYKVEFTDDGQPLRMIEIETGEVCEEYQYGPDGILSAILSMHFGEDSLWDYADFKLDQYGNLVEYANYWEGIYVQYEWIRLPDAKQPD